jgi:Arc/MetJ-type ribon-helix-helix transcriptional regulator
MTADEPMVRIAGRVPPDVALWARENYETESEAVREALTRLMHAETNPVESTQVVQPVYPYAMAEHVIDLSRQLEEKDRQIDRLFEIIDRKGRTNERLNDMVCAQIRANLPAPRHWWQIWK